MGAFIDEKIDYISQRVLLDEPDVDIKLYRNRLRLLYSVILEEMAENESVYDVDGIIEQIHLFEMSQLYLTEINLEQYSDITPNVVFGVFSTVAFSLAVEHLKGKNYLGLSDMLSTVFQGFINSADIEFDKMTLSEIILDFNFASGNSEIMSLRLKTQWDAMK